jgi:hypothetical protein
MLQTFSKQAGGPAAASTREREFSVIPPDTQTGPVVRRATPADLPGIGGLGALLVEEHHGFDPRRFLAASRGTPEGYASYISTQLEDPDVAVLVADDGRKVIGYAYAAVEGYDYMALRGPAGVLHDIVVERESRGRGVWSAAPRRRAGVPQVARRPSRGSVYGRAERGGAAALRQRGVPPDDDRDDARAGRPRVLTVQTTRAYHDLRRTKY